MKRILTIALLLCLAAPAAAGGRYPDTIPLPNGWTPEGIATGDDRSFYSGNRVAGGIYKGDLKTGRGDVLVEPEVPAVPALGMKVDRRDRLFVAGGGSGTASVYDAHSGELLERYKLTEATPTFVNDVIVTRRSAYFTDSQQKQLYVLDLGRHGRLPAHARTLALKDLPPFTGFALNGIEATHRRLIAVHGGLGKLFAIDPRDGQVEEIVLEGGDGNVLNGDGLLLDGRTLYVVQNRLNKIAVVKLDRDLDEGEITGYLTDSDFDVPTTIAEHGGYLWAVNARFTTTPTPDTEYDVVRVRR